MTIPDLLLSDIVMPGGMTGIKRAQELRRQSRNLKVIFTSGYSQELFRAELQNVPGAEFLPKLFGPQEFGQTLRAFLGAMPVANEKDLGH